MIATIGLSLLVLYVAVGLVVAVVEVVRERSSSVAVVLETAGLAVLLWPYFGVLAAGERWGRWVVVADTGGERPIEYAVAGAFLTQWGARQEARCHARSQVLHRDEWAWRQVR